jgi:DNA recombination protein RmuC
MPSPPIPYFSFPVHTSQAMPEILYAVVALALPAALDAAARALPQQIARALEDKHRAMLADLHGGLVEQSDRLASRLSEELNRRREALARFAVEFERFDARLKDLAHHARQAAGNAECVQVTGDKVSQQFQRIESVGLEPERARLLEGGGWRGNKAGK